MSYLADILEQQRVAPAIEAAVRARRVEVERMLQGEGRPRFYYGGSYGKHTMIAAQFDLDVVVYFPPDTAAPPEALYDAVERRLRAAGHHAARHNVALRLRYTPAWHIDVVPGRARDDSYEYADLYASETATLRRTSLKRHIALARNGDRDVIKLLKLWRWRNAVPIGSFVLELAAAGALRGTAGATLEDRFARVLEFLAGPFVETHLVDPANPANIVTDDIDWGRKTAIAASARQAADSTLSRVVW